MPQKGINAFPFLPSSRRWAWRLTQGKLQKDTFWWGTQNRREELHNQLEAFLCANSMSAKDAERLRGRMIFFEGYTFGRVANAAVKTMGRMCTGPRAAKNLDDSSRRALQFLKQRVLSGPPLKIEKALHSTWFIFTDGACDQVAKTGSIGGVIYSPSGECLRFFGESVPPNRSSPGPKIQYMSWRSSPFLWQHRCGAVCSHILQLCTSSTTSRHGWLTYVAMEKL